MTGADTGQRHALVDSNVIFSRAARTFIGQLAEHGQIVLGVNDYILYETRKAIQKRVNAKGRNKDWSQKETAKYRSNLMSRFDKWLRYHKKTGMLRIWTEKDYLPQLISERKEYVLFEEWKNRKTDPEDEGVAVTVIMCRLNALITNNYNMISDFDWQETMDEMGIDQPPALLRSESIIDWMTNEPGVWRDPDWIIDFALAVMRAGPNLHNALMDWTTSIRGIFPEMSNLVNERLQNLSEEILREKQTELSGKDLYPVTREYLQSEVSRI